MSLGTMLLNWGVLILGIAVFCFGELWMFSYAESYRNHIARYGRSSSSARELTTSLTKANTRGMRLVPILWTVCIASLATGLLYVIGAARVGVPFFVGCVVALTGIVLFFAGSIGSFGLARREAANALGDHAPSAGGNEDKDSAEEHQ